jgi:starvation-inducible outer membrane lipoprotein
VKRLAIGLSACVVLPAAFESAPPQEPKSLLEKTTVSDLCGVRTVRLAYLTP